MESGATGMSSQRTERRGYPALRQAAMAAIEKTALRQNALIIIEGGSGVSLLSSVRATWAPTPVPRHHFANLVDRPASTLLAYRRHAPILRSRCTRRARGNAPQIINDKGANRHAKRVGADDQPARLDHRERT